MLSRKPRKKPSTVGQRKALRSQAVGALGFGQGKLSKGQRVAVRSKLAQMKKKASAEAQRQHMWNMQRQGPVEYFPREEPPKRLVRDERQDLVRQARFDEAAEEKRLEGLAPRGLVEEVYALLNNPNSHLIEPEKQIQLRRLAGYTKEFSFLTPYEHRDLVRGIINAKRLLGQSVD